MFFRNFLQCVENVTVLIRISFESWENNRNLKRTLVFVQRFFLTSFFVCLKSGSYYLEFFYSTILNHGFFTPTVFYYTKFDYNVQKTASHLNLHK